MNLLPRRLIFAGHLGLTIAYMYTHFIHLQMLIAILLHLLVLLRDSSCFPDHCLIPDRYREQHRCLQEQCKIMKWCRMKHCYKCKRCIHRFDHHCVLLDLCIGQFNYKYYFLFLFSLLYNTITILVSFTEQMRLQVKIDDDGVETFTWKYYLYGLALMGVYFNIIMTTYLVTNHTYYLIKNVTTWQYCKRNSINYLQNTKTYPFDKGCLSNIFQMFTTNDEKPIDWALELQK